MAVASRIGVNDANRKWWILNAMGLTLGMVLLDETVVGVALDTVQRDLGATDIQGHWIVNAYLLTLAAFVAVAGRLADIHGFRRVLLVGLFLFGAGSLASALSGGPLTIITARAVQGIGGAVIFPLSLALVTISFPEEERGKAIGIYGLYGTTGLTVGPLTGGAFTEFVSWRWIFGINPFIVLAVVFVVVYVWEEPPRTGDRPSVDWVGLGLLTTALSTLVLALMQASDWGWDAPVTVILLVAGAAALVVFWRVELRTDDPLLSVALFRNPSFTSSNLGILIGQASKSTVIVFLALYLQQVLDFSAIEAGLALMPGALASVAVSVPGGKLVDRIGPGLPLLWGLGGTVAALFWIAGVADLESYAVLVPALVVWGLGVVLSFEGGLTGVVNAVPVTMQGQAAGISNEAQMVGGAFGIAVLSALQTSGLSWTAVFLAPPIAALAVFLLALRTVDRSRPAEAPGVNPAPT